MDEKNKHEELAHPHQAPEEKENFFFEIIKFALIALLIVVPIRFYIAQPFVVSGASMEPSFESGDYLIVDQLSYRLGTPERGDVIVFKLPLEPSKFLIKRVIGLPNEEVEIKNGKVVIENVSGRFEIAEPYLSEENKSEESLTKKLAEGEYFVLGDNRSASFDSRTWGVLPEELITGQAFLRLLPVAEISLLPGGIVSQ